MRTVLPDVYDDVLEEKLKTFAQQIETKYSYIFIYDNINKPKLCSTKKIAVNFLYIVVY